MQDEKASREKCFLRQLWRQVLLAFAVGTVLAGAVMFALEDWRRQTSEQQARRLAMAAAHDLGAQLDRGLSATYALAALVRQGRGRVEKFPEIAKELLQIHRGVSALQLAPGGVVTEVVPLEGNQSVVGFSPLYDPVQGPEARMVVEQRILGLTGPFELRQGGIGVVGRLPIFLREGDAPEQFWGLVQVMIRVDALLAETRFEDLRAADFDYELWRIPSGETTRQIFARSRPDNLVSPVVEPIRVPNGQWMIGVAPAQGWLSPAVRLLMGVLAVALGALLAWLVYVLLRQPLILQRQVAIGNRNFQASEERYRRIFMASPVPMVVFEKGTWQLLDANEAFIEHYGFPRGVLPVMRLTDVYPEEEVLSLANGGEAVLPDLARHRRQSGEVFDVEVVLHDVDYQGKVASLLMATDVTERKWAEETLRRQNAWLKSILDHFPDGVSVMDSDIRIALWNVKFLELLDFPEAMFDTKPLPRLIDFLRFNAERGEYGPVDVEQYLVQAAARINLHEPHHFERVRPNGRVIEVRGSPLPDGGFVTSYSDITERKAAEAALRQSEQRFRDLFDRSPDPCWLIEGNLFVDCNRAAVDILGYASREDLLATHPSRLSPEYQRDGRLSFEKAEEMIRIAYERQVHRFEWEHLRHDGTAFPVEVTLARLEMGGHEMLYCVWRDISARLKAVDELRAANQRYEQLNAALEARVAERTRSLEEEIEERRQVEAAVKQSSQWLREIIDTISSGVVLWNRHQCLMAWNQTFESLFPEAAHALVHGMTRNDFWALLDASNALSLIGEEEGEWDRLGRWERVLPDGRVIAIERLATSEGGRLVLHRDITEQVRTNEALARNERMASLGSLVAGVAHEINTPIGNALMVASSVGDRVDALLAALEQSALKRSELREFLSSAKESKQILARNLERAATLIQNFKQVAVDQTSDRRRQFDLAAALEELRVTLVPSFRRTGHQLDIDIPGGLFLDSYPGALGQVVTNLVENALVHAFDAGQSGTIRITARGLEGERVELLFSDNGRGIPADVLPRIFHPFFTTRLGQGGSGLGLSIVLNLVQDLLGGELTVSSQTDEGTTFRMIIPQTAPQRSGDEV